MFEYNGASYVKSEVFGNRATMFVACIQMQVRENYQCLWIETKRNFVRINTAHLLNLWLVIKDFLLKQVLQITFNF